MRSSRIEPDPGLLRRAECNVLLNDLGNVRLVNAAASDRAGQLSLYRPDPADTNRARASLLRHSYLTGDSITVPVVTVDSVCGDVRVALIKIDVEGHESAVIRGAARTIDRHAPAVALRARSRAARRGRGTVCPSAGWRTAAT